MFLQSSFSDINLSLLQAYLKGWSGTVSLNLELLKQCRDSAVTDNSIKHAGASDRVFLSKHITISTQCSSTSSKLSTKLAEWIVENMQYKLVFLISRALQSDVYLNCRTFDTGTCLTEMAARCTP